MAAENIAPSGEGSTIEPGVVPQDKPGTPRPSTYRGSGKVVPGNAKPAQDSIGHSSAGPVGSSVTQPNPYQAPGGPGADVSQGDVYPPYSKARPEGDGRAPAPRA